MFSSDFGVHIDGFIAQVAHTIVVAGPGAATVEGRKADVIAAAYNAVQAAVRTIKPGNTNYDVRIFAYSDVANAMMIGY